MRLLPKLRKTRFAQFVLAAGLCLDVPSWCLSQAPPSSQTIPGVLPEPIKTSAPAAQNTSGSKVTSRVSTGDVSPWRAASDKKPTPGGDIKLVQDQAPPVVPPPVQPPPVQPPPVQPPATQPPPAAATTAAQNPLGTPGQLPAGLALTPSQTNIATQPSSNLVTGNQALPLAATDAGSLLVRSPSVVGVENQFRSPIANETRVRGERLGQIQTWADGQYWFPARQDLDTFLSKIDSGNIQNTIVVKGPYAAHLGPGLSFIDIQTVPPPRYENGFEWHGRTVGQWMENGEQVYGRQTIDMGSYDWGMRISYGQRTGNDYQTGNGPAFAQEASYNSRDVDFAYSVDLTRDSHLEFDYMRLDQTNLEFPGQIFDTDDLLTYAFHARYVLENQDLFDSFMLEGYYNRTTLHGDAQHPAKRRQIPQLGQIAPNGMVVGGLEFTGFTDIDEASMGYRAAMTWGKPKDPQLTIGTDFRRMDQTLNELDTLLNLAIPCGNIFNFPIPPSQTSFLGGLYAEYVNPVSEDLTVKMGARGDVDWANITGLPFGVSCTTFQQQEQAIYGTTDTDRTYGLYLAYLTAEYKLDENITLLGGAGSSERPPTLTELYAMGPYLAILQQGFTTVLGNPELRPEQLYQVDLAMRANYDNYRFGASGFYSWIHNYITFAAEPGSTQGGITKLPSGLTNALTVKFVNTTLATLAGGEAYGEVDMGSYLTPFFTTSYVTGRDLTRDQRGASPVQTGLVRPGIGNQGASKEPLPMIPPLETRIGVRFHEPRRDPRWAIELTARWDTEQHQVAESLGELPSAGFVVWDLRAYWQAYDGVLITAGFENLFDKFYRTHLDLLTGNGVYEPGRNFYVGMELRY